METTGYLNKRKALDIPFAAIRSLAIAAAAKGISLKKYMENPVIEEIRPKAIISETIDNWLI
mgnify:CR=1 FL=1